MSLISLFIGILIGAVAAAITTWFIAKSKFEKQKSVSNEEIDALIQLNREIAEKDNEIKNLTGKLETQKEEMQSLQEKLKTDFENLANKILEEKTQKFTEQNRTNLKQVLDPLGERIKEFEKKVDETYVRGTRERSALAQQIKALSELNKQMSEDASNLTKALKGDSKTQGDWGEFRLELILEKAGLTKDIHYTTQGTFRDEEGALKKPDFIIKLPENKNLIIDSKVSLSAYEAYHNCDDENQKALFLKNHINSVRNHIKDLGSKKYQNLYQINSPDYVLMFIPIEPAFILALQNNEQLYLEALDKNIVLVTTSTLLATMRTVSSVWQQEDQKKNVLEIARQGGELYNDFVRFTDHLIKVGKSLDAAKGSYSDAMKKLYDGRGNLIKRADDLKKLGAKTSKSINQSLIDRANETDTYLIETTD